MTGALVIELLSATTPGRGLGTPGQVDVEIDTDEVGLPRIGGKVLHGAMRDAWYDMEDHFPQYAEAARRVLGPSADLGGGAIVRVGDARLSHRRGEPPGDPDVLHAWVAAACTRVDDAVAPSEIVAALTTIRHQTALSRLRGSPEPGTLRATRALRPGLCLTASLRWSVVPQDKDWHVLTWCAQGVRHLGLGRNRGRGHVKLTVNRAGFTAT